MGVDSSPDGGRGEARMTCALGGTGVQGHSWSMQFDGEGRANQMAVLQKQGYTPRQVPSREGASAVTG